MKDRILFLLLSAVAVTPLFSQEISDRQIEMFHSHSQLLSPEKVYLHTDKDVYFATDTIWFSGYVENASYASEFDESNYIYVELISNQLYRDAGSWSNFSYMEPSVIERKKIKRFGNSFSGYIVVPEMNSTGRGIIRAYTYWMLNRPVEYMFYKELELVNPMKDRVVTELNNKKKGRAEYLRLGEKSPYDENKNIDEKHGYDVQFLPESGNYIYEARAVLYIKSIDKNGLGARIYGHIYDSDRNIICEYSTDSLGFGKLVIPSVPQGPLFASVKDSLGYEETGIPLQEALEQGVIIEGEFKINQDYGYSDSDILRINIKLSGKLSNDSLAILIHNGSEIYFKKMLHSEYESLLFKLKSLTAGIHSATVLDFAGNVYAQRTFIVLPDPQRQKVNILADTVKYGKREKVSFRVRFPSDKVDKNHNFSISVTDMGIAEDKEHTTIESYMFMKSELKGYIEKLEWYFNDTIPLNRRMDRADMLLQTQGWRYYDVGKILKGENDIPYFGREYRQTLFGKVINPLRLSRKATVSFIAQSINFTAMGQVDSGYWVLKDIDFPEKTRFIISAVGKNGKSTAHTPILQDDYFAAVFNYPVKPEKVVYTSKYAEVAEDIYYSKDDGEYAMAFNLNPAVVTSQLIIPQNSPSPIPNYPIRRDWYRDSLAMKPYMKNYNLGAYIAEAFPGVRYNSGGGLIGYKMVPATGMKPPKREGFVIVYLNRIPVSGSEIWSVLQMPLDEVESVIYVSGLSALPFQTSGTMMDMYPSPVLMVRTKPHVRTSSVPYNVSGGYPLGWQKPVKFYSPKYDTPDSKKSKTADNRITLYWNPSLKLDENGEAVVSFYTSDSDTNYRIEIEGRSAAGQYHYTEKIIGREIKAINKSR